MSAQQDFLALLPGRISRRLRRTLGVPPAYLRRSKGVVHIGANDGAEAELYDRVGLDVVWVEAIPDVFDRLSVNIEPYARQKALNYLLADQDGETYNFNVASNRGASSSIYDFGEHAELWPGVTFTEKIALTSATFATMVERERIDLARYDCLVIDVQGAELLVLRGAKDLLSGFRYILAEGADFGMYKGQATRQEMTEYLAGRGFREKQVSRFAAKKGVGSVYDILYERRSP